MRKFNFLKMTLLAMVMMVGSVSVMGQEVTIAGWTFPTSTGNASQVISAECGILSSVSTIYADGTNGSDSWGSSGSLFYFAGNSNISAPCNVTSATGALSLVNINPGYNGSSIVFKLSTSEHKSLKLNYDTRGTKTGFTSHEWQYSTDGISFTAKETITGRNSTSFSKQNVDFSNITDLDNQNVVYIKLTVSGADGTGNGNNRLDNINFVATPAPSCTTPNISFANPTVNKTTADENFTIVATSDNGTTPITYESNDENIATVNSNTGEVTIVGAGTAIITANQAAGTHNSIDYCEGSASYELIVTSTKPTISSNPAELNVFTAYVNKTSTQTITVSGYNLTGNISLALSGANAGQFSVNPASATQAGGVVNETQIDVSYNPTSPGTHSAALTISSPGADDVAYSLSGTSTYEPLPAPVATAASNEAKTGFTANWVAVEGATGYDVNVYTKQETPVVTLLTEDFSSIVNGNSTTSNGSSTAWNGNENFPTVTSAYQAGGAVKLGTGSLSGSITSKLLNLNSAQDVVVSFDVKGWTTVEGEIIITLGAKQETITYSAVMAGSFENKSVTFTGISDEFTVSIATSAKRAFIDNVIITSGDYSNIPISGSPFTVTDGSTTSYDVTGLTQNTTYDYTVTAKNDNVNSEKSNEIEVTTLGSAATDAFRSAKSGNWNDVATWETSDDNTNWYPSSLTPTSEAAGVSIEANHLVTVAANATAPSVTVKPTGKLTVNDGFTLASSITLQSDEFGTATLIGAVTGTAEVQQYSANKRTYYMGSPVNPLTVLSGIENIATFDIANDTWSSLTTDFTSNIPTDGRGFLAQTPIGTMSFKGTLNNGNVVTTLAQETKSFNFLGNPYPSYLRSSDIAAATGIDGTVWQRTKGTEGFLFVTYNATGEGASLPTGYDGSLIAPMQGFWVNATAAGTFTFTNDMRTHNVDGAGSFKAPRVAQSQRLVLAVSNGTSTDEAMLRFNSDAGTGIDNWDSRKMMNSAGALNVYTLHNGVSLAINSNSAITEGIEIPVGLSLAAGTYTLSAKEFTNFAAGTKVNLLDKATGLVTDLSVADYEFTLTESLNSSARFAIVFPKSDVPTSVEGLNDAKSTIFVRDNRIVVSTNEAANGGMIYVFNSVGQQIAAQSVNGKVNEINMALQPGVYVVKLKNQTEKVIVK